MKPKQQLQAIIDEIASDASPVGMDAVYVHALILDKLSEIERRLDEMEARQSQIQSSSATAATDAK